MRSVTARGDRSRRGPEMDAFEIDPGTHGAGEARYAAGLLTLPDGHVRPIEEVVGVHLQAGEAEPLDRVGAMVGGLRGALAASTPASLPLRLAFSTFRAGLGVIEEGLRPASAGSVVEIAFADGATVTARMPPEAAALIRRDAEIAHGVLARRETARPVPVLPSPVLPSPVLPSPVLPLSVLPAPELPPAADPTPDEALTSIFRYEKRNGRLRRVAVPAQAPEG